MLRALIRQGASEGSFDRVLAADTPGAIEFFAKLKRALVSGYFVEEDPKTGRVEAVAVPGYVFWPDDRNSGMPPVGFGLFRALAEGYELWLAGLELERRGGGHGKALIEALLATAPGKKTWVVRIPRGSRYASAVQHILKPFGFAHAGDTVRLRWFVRQSAPAAVLARVNSVLAASPPTN
ncbi:MAG TPA: hypothetical protein VF814_07900 [Casimicrobiaceae bacterium]